MRFYKFLKKAVAAVAAGLILLTSVTASAETVNVTVGEALQYPSGFGHMTHYFYMDGQLAYCLQPRLGPMSSGTKEVTYISSDGADGYPLLVKILACGYGGPNDLTGVYFPGASDKDRYIYTHIAAGYAYMTIKESQSTLNDITGLTNEQFESSGLGNFVRAANSTGYTGTIKVVRTEGYQDIGYLFSYKDTTYVPPTYTYDVPVIKTNTDSKPLSGAKFGVFADSSCNTKITDLPETDINGRTSVSLKSTYSTLYIKEIKAPYGYEADSKVAEVTPSDSEKTFVNKDALGKIVLHKSDSVNGEAQGDGTLKDAVYELSAGEQIVDVEGNVIYEKGDFVATFITDENGTDYVDGLRPGEYILKEITAPVGYHLDDNEYHILLSYDETKGTVPERTVNVKDDVIKGAFEINKARTDNREVKIAGAGFRAYLLSELKSDGNGGYDFSLSKPIILTEDGKDILYTDENGYAKSAEIPYGTYVIREEVVPKNYIKANDFTITVSDTGENIQKVDVDEDVYRISIRINKYDAESGNRIEGEGNDTASFAIYDTVNMKYVEKGIKLNEKGIGYSSKLEAGHYRLEEERAPSGYARSLDYVYFDVDDEEKVIFDSFLNENVMDLSFYNIPFKGQIKIDKSADIITGFTSGNEATYTSGCFRYSQKALEGTEFGLYAKDNIFYPDGRCDSNGNRAVMFTKNQLIETMVTGTDGSVVSKTELYAGEYYIEETKALNGYVPLKDKIFVQIGSDGTQTEVSEMFSVKVSNKQTSLSAVALKKDVKDQRPLLGAYFSLYADSDIYSGDKLIIKKGTYIETAVSSSDGTAHFSDNLPEGEYYIREVKAPEGYEIDTRPYRFKLVRGNEPVCEVCEFYDMPKPKEKPGTIVLGASYTKTSTNNYMTDDIGVGGFSVIKKSQTMNPLFIAAIVILAVCALAAVMFITLKNIGGGNEENI